MKKPKEKSESDLKLFGLVIAGFFGSVITSIIFSIFVIYPMRPYFDIWSKSSSQVWHFLLALLVRYAGAYVIIHLCRRKVDKLTNILPIISIALFQVVSWVIFIYIPSYFQ